MEIIYMKTSIKNLSVNEIFYINGGAVITPSIDYSKLLSTGKELVSSHSKEIGVVGAGGAILATISIAAKFVWGLSKENAAINILKSMPF